jgi:hypothetical protein
MSADLAAAMAEAHELLVTGRLDLARRCVQALREHLDWRELEEAERLLACGRPDEAREWLEDALEDPELEAEAEWAAAE